MEGQVLLSRKELSKRWCITDAALANYETQGIITRVPGIPTPRYHIDEIEKIENEGFKINPLSPIERKRMENRIHQLEQDNLHYQEQINLIRQAIS